MLCSRCKKNISVVFVAKLENGKEKMEGYCLSCATELGINPMGKMMEQMGVDPKELEAGMKDMMENGGEGLAAEMQAMMEEAGADSGILLPFDDMDMDMGSDDSEEPAGKENGPMGFFSKMFQASGFHEPEQESEPSDTKTARPKRRRDKKRKNLETYGVNLTRKAQTGGIDRVVGRDKEIARVIQILNRRNKNNPVLLGEPGVGKTAIAEGLALRIVEKQVPAKLYGKEVYLLDFAALVAGTQFRGQFESRLKNLIEEVKNLGNIILVIDELHNIMGAGNAEGAMNAANILKPALARGELQIIGATTLEEYRKHIEKDSALERRFQPVMVGEPTIDESIEILRGIKGYYENHHKVSISDDIIRLSVLLSERYIHDRFLPDKAIDVIDEASSKVNLANTGLIQLLEYEKRLEEIQSQKETAVQSDSIEEYQKAADLKVEECRLKEEIEALQKECYGKPVTEEDVASVIELWTRIPVQKINMEHSKQLLHLEDTLHRRVIAQEDAVSLVARAVRRRRAGVSAARRPVSFIFVGPTGVGKTELVKALTEAMFGSEEAFIRLDMSEYMEKHTVSKLIGSPPGYVGYEEAGQLTEKVRRNPYSVILLDEIEKAHADVFNILLQVLDDGRITDSQGRVVNFDNTILIMTSNAGSERSAESIGFGGAGKPESRYEKTLKEIFRPEFLNRIDEIVEFQPLEKPQLLQIVDLMLDDVRRGLALKEIELEVTEAAKELLLEKGYEPQYGARPIRRCITRHVEDLIADLLIGGSLPEGSAVLVDVHDGNFVAQKCERTGSQI